MADDLRDCRTNPFAWMVGQIEEAVAHQQPMGAVALPPGMKSVVACIKELGHPITCQDLAARARVSSNIASGRLYKAERAGVVRVVGDAKWQGKTRRVFDLTPEWRE